MERTGLIEQELYDFIVKNNPCSINVIKAQLGENYIGALGKLLQEKKIEKIRKKEAKDTYATKMVNYYQLVKEGEKTDEV